MAFLAGSDDSNNKSAFTKYNNKERKVEKDVTISSTNTNLAENTSNTADTTSSMILPNVSNPNLNMLQFPALRKLLDITGKKNPRYIFSSNHNIHKSSCGILWGAPYPLIDRIVKNLWTKWSGAQKQRPHKLS